MKKAIILSVPYILGCTAMTVGMFMQIYLILKALTQSTDIDRSGLHVLLLGELVSVVCLVLSTINLK